MKLPERLEQTDDLVAALVRSHRAAEVPAPPMNEILARAESGKPNALDELAPPTHAFRPLFGAKAWIFGAAGIAVLSGMALVATSHHRSSSSPSAEDAPALPAAVSATSRPTDEPPTAIPSMDVASLPSVAPSAPKVVMPSSKPAVIDARPSTSTPASSLRRELELVDAARRALRGGDGTACLAAVDRYDQEFPSGQFTHEGQVMRIEALSIAGSREKAGSLARAFLQANPKSPYADRVRSVLTRVEGP